MSPEESNAQYQGFRIDCGKYGYLREAYHGEPYATRALLPEAFEAQGAPVTIPAEVLKDRLPAVLDAARQRAKILYNEDSAGQEAAADSFADFVELVERLEREGRHPRIEVSY